MNATIGNIDWDVLEGPYFKLPDGIPITIKWDNVSQGQTTIEDQTKPTLEFHIVEINGKQVDKKWSVLSTRLIQKLKSIVQGNKTILTITQVGEGKKREWAVQAI